MTTREEYIKIFENKLKELNSQINELEKRAKSESREFRNKIDEKTAELKVKCQQLELKLVKIRNAGEETLKKAREEADYLRNKIKEGLDDIKNIKKKKRNSNPFSYVHLIIYILGAV